MFSLGFSFGMLIKKSCLYGIAWNDPLLNLVHSHFGRLWVAEVGHPCKNDNWTGPFLLPWFQKMKSVNY